MSRRHRPAFALVAWATVLAAVVAVLHGLGGPLAPPPLGDGRGFRAWFEQRQPPEVVFGLLRLVALALAWYLLAVTLAGTAGRVLRLRTLVTALDAVTVPVVRRLVDAAMGLSVVAAALAGTPGVAGAAGDSAPPPVEVMRRLPDAGVPGEAAPETMRRLPDNPAGPPGVPPPQGGAEAAGTAAPPAPAAAPVTWKVAPGDHFWSVAERVLARARQRPPADAEVDPYWRSLVAANRDRLRDPANPDLLFPGQELVVPPVPAALP